MSSVSLLEHDNRMLPSAARGQGCTPRLSFGDRRSRRWSAYALVLGTGFACAEHINRPPPVPAVPTVATVVVSPTVASMQVGTTLQLTAQARDASGAVLAGRPITWASENVAAASVTASGLVTAIIAGGAVNVTATSESKSATARISVSYASKDSAMAKAGAETVLHAGNGAEVRFAANSLPIGTSIVAQEIPGRIGTFGTPLGSSINIFIRNPASATSNGQLTTSTTVTPFTLTLSGVSSLSATDGLYQLTGFSQGLPEAPMGSTVALLPRTVTASAGTPAGLTANFTVGTTFGSTPASISTQLAVLPAGCSQSDLPDALRLRLLRTASMRTASTSPIVLVLVHGWQAQQLSCADTRDFDYPSDPTWARLITEVFPNGGAGVEPRLQQFDVWTYQYLPTSRFIDVGDDLARLLRSQFPTRKVVLLAHSKGGLVSAAAMLTLSPSQVLRLVTAGTPWNGTPAGGVAGIIGVGCYLVNPLSFVWEQLTSLEECSLLSRWALGARDLGTAASGDIATKLTPRRNELDGRVTALGSSISPFGTHFKGAEGFPMWTFYEDMAFYLPGGKNDGLVPLSSSQPSTPGYFTSPPALQGFNHSGYLSVTPPGVTPTGQSQIVSELLKVLDASAPVASVTIFPTSVTMGVGGTQPLIATLKDVSDATLTGRAVVWKSSDENIARVSQAGIVTAVNGSASPVTITASSEGKSASVPVTVSLAGTDEWRAVLTWSGAVIDLDPHLTGPTPTGGRFTVNYANSGSCIALPFACLDGDISSISGPESITISRSFAGKYTFFVHNYSDSRSTTSVRLGQSNARVDLYRGNQVYRRFVVPAAPGTLWTVFEIDGGVVKDINTVTYVDPPAASAVQSSGQSARSPVVR